MRNDIHELKTSAKIFQLMKCTLCSQALDLPAFHFLCMHSFHQRFFFLSFSFQLFFFFSVN